MNKRPTRPDHRTRSRSTHSGRRKALKVLAAGGGVAALRQWTKPVIETAVLPAHAQATGNFTGGFAGALGSQIVRNDWLDLVVPKAAAGLTVCGDDAGAPICIDVVDNAVSVQVYASGGLLTGNGTLVGGSFTAPLGGASQVSGTLNGAQTQFTGTVTLECAPPLDADASGVFTGERVQVASLMLAGAVVQTAIYSFTANLGALCAPAT